MSGTLTLARTASLTGSQEWKNAAATVSNGNITDGGAWTIGPTGALQGSTHLVLGALVVDRDGTLGNDGSISGSAGLELSANFYRDGTNGRAVITGNGYSRIIINPTTSISNSNPILRVLFNTNSQTANQPVTAGEQTLVSLTSDGSLQVVGQNTSATSAPQIRLDQSTSVTSESILSSYMFVNSYPTTGSSTARLQFGANWPTANIWGWGADVSSNITLGSYSYPSGKVVNTLGTISSAGVWKNTSGTWSTLSDARLKTNVTTLSGSLDKVMQLHPVTYDWIEDVANPLRPKTGFIAQEVATVLPQLVVQESESYTQDGYSYFLADAYTLNLGSEMFAYLVGALQELKTEFEAYKAAHP